MPGKVDEVAVEALARFAIAADDYIKVLKEDLQRLVTDRLVLCRDCVAWVGEVAPVSGGANDGIERRLCCRHAADVRSGDDHITWAGHGCCDGIRIVKED